jgi:hypothetical protein
MKWGLSFVFLSGDFEQVTEITEEGRSKKRCRTSFATAVQIRPRYDLAFDKIAERMWERGIFGVEIGFAFKINIF